MHRHWASDRYGKRQHTLKVDVATGAITDLTPGDIDTPTIAPSVNRGYAFSPDGLELCVVSKRDPDEEQSTNNDLWLYPMASGAPRMPHRQEIRPSMAIRSIRPMVDTSPSGSRRSLASRPTDSGWPSTTAGPTRPAS